MSSLLHINSLAKKIQLQTQPRIQNEMQQIVLKSLGIRITADKKAIIFSWMLGCTNPTQGENKQVLDNFFGTNLLTRAYKNSFSEALLRFEILQPQDEKDIQATEP